MRNEGHSQPVYPDRIHFYHTFRPNPDGSNSVFQVAVSPGPTLWLKARDLHVPEHIMAEILELPGVTVFKHQGFRYVSMNAVIETCPCLETARKVQQWVDDTLDELHPTNFRKP